MVLHIQPLHVHESVLTLIKATDPTSIKSILLVPLPGVSQCCLMRPPLADVTLNH